MLKILGCRGTNSVYGEDFNGYGSYTSSLITTYKNQAFIFDMGTGIFNLNYDELKEINEFHIFFTHLHWDHILGMLRFKPFFKKNVKINFYLSSRYGFNDANSYLTNVFRSPFYPVGIELFKSKLSLYLVEDRDHYLFENIKISYIEGNHPNFALIYKIVIDKKIYIYATDYEHSEESDKRLITFSKDSDYLIFDTTYTPEDYEGKFDGISKKGWGHSTYIKGCEIAKHAGIKNFVLFHHNPDYKDEMLEKIYLSALKLFPNSIIAKDNLLI
jgi:ribonuclease BN (tRNA processing enzyme)